MRGEVLDFDRTTQSGVISGDDGRRYRFLGAEVQRGEQLRPGDRIDFEVHGETARQIFRLAAAASSGIRVISSDTSMGRPSNVGSSASGSATSWSPPIERTTESAPVPDRSLWDWYLQAFGMLLPIKGRARRREYWGFVLFNVLISIPLYVFAFAAKDFSIVAAAAMLLLIIYFVLAMGGSFKTSVRRLHDVGLSGWFILVALIPYLGALALFVLHALPSQPHDNRWGPPAAPR